MRTINLCFAIALGFANLAPHALGQASQPATNFPTDERTHRVLDDLLRGLEGHALDAGTAGIEQVEARDQAFRTAMDSFAAHVRQRAADDVIASALHRDAVMLRNSVAPRLSGRCAACGYDLKYLPGDRDGCTVCAECGAAWRIGAWKEGDESESESE